MAEEKVRVLVVDDEAAIRQYLHLGLQYEGFEVRLAADAGEAFRLVHEWDPHVVLVDVMLPDTDGFTLARELRSDEARILIFLTARDEVEDRVHGLDLGGDDYLVKPFDFRELVARMRRHLHRLQPTLGQDLQFGPLRMDLARHHVTKNGRDVVLTAREFDLLAALMRHAGQVLSKQTLLDLVWGHDFYGDSNVVEVHTRALRTKLGDAEHRLIQTVRGVGYRIGD